MAALSTLVSLCTSRHEMSLLLSCCVEPKIEAVRPLLLLVLLPLLSSVL
jgi:hypothetical protein